MNTFTLTVPAAAEVIEPEFATIPTTRKVTGLSRTTLYELQEEGEIRFIRVRKRGRSRGRADKVSFSGSAAGAIQIRILAN
jgi:hypothetical protein